MLEQTNKSIQAGILSPFEGGAPAGEDLRLNPTPGSLYFRLRDARDQARDEERLLDNDPMSGGAASAAWGTVHELATKALVAKSKDV